MRPREELIEAWMREERQPFRGWDFSHLRGRMTEGHPPWSYMTRAAERMGQVSSVLDIGTGGGERLLQLRPHWPDKVVATEGHPPNVKLATERLSPLGVTVVDVARTGGRFLPFDDASFELVLNRHSEFSSAEVARVLSPHGTFLTQQVDGRWAHDLRNAFGFEPELKATLQRHADELKRAGLEIVDAEQWSGDLTFRDVGAVVYYLRAVPWIVPGFSVARNLDVLLTFQDQLEHKRCLTFTARKYWIEARKPAGGIRSGYVGPNIGATFSPGTDGAEANKPRELACPTSSGMVVPENDPKEWTTCDAFSSTPTPHPTTPLPW